MKQIDSNPKLDEKIDCRLEQNESGEWLIYIGKIGRPLPASIIEIVLWLKIKELEELLREKQK